MDNFGTRVFHGTNNNQIPYKSRPSFIDSIRINTLGIQGTMLIADTKGIRSLKGNCSFCAALTNATADFLLPFQMQLQILCCLPNATADFLLPFQMQLRVHDVSIFVSILILRIVILSRVSWGWLQSCGQNSL